MLFLLLVFMGSASTPAQPPVCGGPGPYADAQLARVRRLAADSSAASDSLRRSLGLPRVAPDAVQLVASDSVCLAASAALRRTLGRSDAASATTWVIRVGPARFWVYDPRFTSVVDVVHGVFDADWRNLSLITG